MSNNKNKNALVTGAAKRLGREIALFLAREGWNVAIHSHTSSADEVIKEAESYGVKAVEVKGDLNNFSELRQVVLKANEQLGEISLLINNASIFEQCRFMDTEEDIFDRHMAINFKAPFYLSQDFARQSEGGGHIINICDTFVLRNRTSYFSYLLSKKSFRDLSKMLALELAPEHRVNTLLPGTIQEFSNNMDEGFISKRTEELPMGELVKAPEILDTIKYLLDGNATGQEIFLDGGEHLI